MKKLLFTLLFGSSLLLRADNIAKKLSVCTNKDIPTLGRSSVDCNEKTDKQTDSALKNAFFSSRTARIVNGISITGSSMIGLLLISKTIFDDHLDTFFRLRTLDDAERMFKIVLALSIGQFHASPSLAVMVNPECDQEESRNRMLPFIVRGILHAGATACATYINPEGTIFFSLMTAIDLFNIVRYGLVRPSKKE